MEWIKVSERLPRNDRRTDLILTVELDDGERLLMYGCRYYGRGTEEPVFCYWDDYYECVKVVEDKVIAWMEYPDIYEGEP